MYSFYLNLGMMPNWILAAVDRESLVNYIGFQRTMRYSILRSSNDDHANQ